MRVLAQMEAVGVKLDPYRLGEITARVRDRIDEVTDEIFRLAGGPFTVGSPQQLADVLFVRLELEATRKGKTGYSTDATVLRGLRDKHPIVPLVEEWRELTKLLNTYLEPLPARLDPVTGRLHTTFNQLVASTGRLSSSNPNLQNIPVRTELGAEIRACFVAEEGCKLLVADYSQIELRLMASLSREPALLDAYHRGEDVHRVTAAAVAGIAVEEVTKKQRERAKATNFGIMYGLSAFGLSEQVDIPVDEAKAFIEAYFAKYPQSEGVPRARHRAGDPGRVRDHAVRPPAGGARAALVQLPQPLAGRAACGQHHPAGHGGRHHQGRDGHGEPGAGASRAGVAAGAAGARRARPGVPGGRARRVQAAAPRRHVRRSRPRPSARSRDRRGRRLGGGEGLTAAPPAAAPQLSASPALDSEAVECYTPLVSARRGPRAFPICKRRIAYVTGRLRHHMADKAIDTQLEAANDPRIVEGSEGYLIEVDGEIVPNYDMTLTNFSEGDIVTGKVVRIDKDEVLVDIGYKSEGVIPVNELSIRKNVNTSEEVGLDEEIDALVMTKEDADGRLILSKKRAKFEKAWKRIEAAFESGEPVTGTVIEVVKGGLILDLGVRGFLPASLVDIRRVQDLQEYVGQELNCRVIEMNRNRNNVVLSRRAVLEEERKEVRQQIIDDLNVGDVVEGTISNIVDFGAFVDLDGIDGLIHISELSWTHINHPSEVLQVNQKVKVKVLDIDRDRQRISLGLKQTQEDPWQKIVARHKVGDVVDGRVTKIVAFGAFVEIYEGIEGLVHISELANRHVERPDEVVSVGQEVSVKIIEVDSERRRLSLSIKRVDGDNVKPLRPLEPEVDEDAEDAEESAEAARSRRSRRSPRSSRPPSRSRSRPRSSRPPLRSPRPPRRSRLWPRPPRWSRSRPRSSRLRPRPSSKSTSPSSA